MTTGRINQVTELDSPTLCQPDTVWARCSTAPIPRSTIKGVHRLPNHEFPWAAAQSRVSQTALAEVGSLLHELPLCSNKTESCLCNAGTLQSLRILLLIEYPYGLSNFRWPSLIGQGHHPANRAVSTLASIVKHISKTHGRTVHCQYMSRRRRNAMSQNAESHSSLGPPPKVLVPPTTQCGGAETENHKCTHVWAQCGLTCVEAGRLMT